MRVHARVGDCANAYIADAEELASSFGKNRFLDDWWHVYAHGAITFHNYSEGTEAPFWLNTPIPRVDSTHDVNEHQFYALVWRQLEAIFRCVRQIDQVKLVILDLDNTIWRGQIAEHYGDGMEWPLSDGWPEGLIEAIHHLRARGILVALCSRNDEGLVTKRWDRAFPRGLLTLDDFVARKINFRSKADQFVMSCRVLGMEVETSVLHCIMADIGRAADGFTARLVETEANMASRDVFTRAGFEPAATDLFVYRDDGEPKLAPHLQLRAAEPETAGTESGPARR